jgi:O-antigen ligase
VPTAPSKLSPSQIWLAIKESSLFVYGVLIVVATTHQPLVYLWFRILITGRPDDPTTQGLEMTIIALQIPAVVLLFQRHLSESTLRIRPHHLVVFLLGFMALSTWWSILPGRTMWDIGIITLSVCSFSYLVLTFSNVRAITTLFLGLQPAVVMSYWAVWRNWEGSKQSLDGPWLGIFGNRNTLAPLAAGVFLSGVFLLLHTVKRRRTLVFVPFVLVLSAMGLVTLLATKSMSSVFGLLFAGVMALFFLVWKSPLLRRMNNFLWERSFATLFIVGVFVLSVSIVFFSDAVSESLGRSSGLSGRTDIWMESLRGMIDKPFFGWGWGTAWLTEEFRAELPAALTEHRWPHSLWMEFGLGGGFAVLALSITWALWGAARSVRMSLRNSKSGLWMVTFPAFALILLSMESMNWTFHWVFAVLVGTYLMAEKTPD